MHTLDQAFYDRLSEALGERLRACEESGRVPVVTGEFDFGFGFCFFCMGLGRGLWVSGISLDSWYILIDRDRDTGFSVSFSVVLSLLFLSFHDHQLTPPQVSSAQSRALSSTK